MPSLHLVDTAAHVSDLTIPKRPPAVINIGGVKVLSWPLTGEVAAVNNEHVGTLHVGMRAFYHFRELCRNRGDVPHDEKRTNIIRDLIAAFCYATCIRWKGEYRRDKFGNLILIDRDEEIMFIVDEERSLLLAVFDKSEHAELSRYEPTTIREVDPHQQHPVHARSE